MNKGQSTIEFLGISMLFIIAITATTFTLTDEIPDFENSIQESSKNMEMYTLTEKMLKNPGLDRDKNQNWEENPNKTVQTGLANENLVLQIDKINALSTTGSNKLNYTRFRKIQDIENQYNFRFVWLPVIETSSTFTRTEPPSNPDIKEPTSAGYSNSENRVHYGQTEIGGDNYRYLITAHNGIYDTARITQNDWNFIGEIPKEVGDELQMNNSQFTIQSIQNRNRRPGTSIILNRTMKNFGPQPDTETGEVTKLNRYAVLNAPATDRHPVRLEVLAW